MSPGALSLTIAAMRTALRPLAAMAALLSFAAPAAEVVKQRAPACPAVGDKAPLFSFPQPMAGNDYLSLLSLRKKKRPIVLSFWSHFCEPCKTELPALQRIAKEWGEKVSVLLIHVGGPEEKMRDELKALKVELPSVIDESAKKSREQYCADTLPRVFVLDARANVRALVGSEGFESNLRAEVGKLLEAK